MRSPPEGSGETGRRGWLYRADIFTKNNIAVPTSYDELYTALKKLKDIYPDTYPLVFRRNVANFELTAPQWGTGQGRYYDYDKKVWRFGPIEPNYKEMVKYFHKLYQDKLIPPDWVTLDTKGWQDIISTSKAFVTFDYASRLDFYNVPMRKENPDFTLAYMIPPVLPRELEPAPAVHLPGRHDHRGEPQVQEPGPGDEALGLAVHARRAGHGELGQGGRDLRHQGRQEGHEGRPDHAGGTDQVRHVHGWFLHLVRL